MPQTILSGNIFGGIQMAQKKTELHIFMESLKKYSK